jgi:Ca-activated chloride channel family protein
MMALLQTWFAHPWMLAALAVLPILGVLWLWAEARRRRALTQFGGGRLFQNVVLARQRSRRWAGTCLLHGLVLLGIAAAGPQWGRDWEQSAAPGRDLVVVLDCSRSMLAGQPSRIELARRALLDLAAAVRQRGGHRLALVLFAGRAQLACPLTQDYDHFTEVIEGVAKAPLDPDLGPGEGELSGTRIGLGLHEAVRALDERSAGVCDLLLLSDGDDPGRDGEWQFGVAEAKARGVPVITIGIGDPDADALLTLPDGREIKTRLEEGVLREIAQETRGSYLAAQTRPLPLGQVWLETLAALPVRQESVDALPAYLARYRLFLLPAFGLLLVAVLLSDRAPRRARGSA